MNKVDMEHVEYWRERAADEDNLPATREFDDDNLAILLGVISALETERDAARNAALEDAAERADGADYEFYASISGQRHAERIRALMTQPAERMVPLAKVKEEARRYIQHAACPDKAYGASCLADALGANVDDALERDWPRRQKDGLP